MSKLRLLILAVVGLLLINFAVVSWFFFQPSQPQHPDNRMPRGEDGPKKMIIERLHFSPEQVQEYEALIKGHRASIRATEDSIRSAKNNLYQTLNSNNAEQKDSLITKLSDLHQQIEQIHYNHFTDIRKICKPDQLDDFNRLTEDLARFFNQGKKRPAPPKD